MNEKFNRSLLPDFIKRPITMLWVYILPQLILLFINLYSYWLISDEISPEKVSIVYTIFAAELGLLALAVFVWAYSGAMKKMIALAWSVVFLATHIGYLWYMSSHMWQLVPNTIEPWILDQGMLIYYQFTFIMPGLFYAGLRLACFEMKIEKRRDVEFTILMTIFAPVVFYILFIGRGTYSHYFKFELPKILAILFFIGTTIIAIKTAKIIWVKSSFERIKL